MNTFGEFVGRMGRLIRAGRDIPLGVEGIGVPHLSSTGRVALNFAPHPDDECINGGLALRLLREADFRIINVPVTLGSNLARRSARLRELTDACRVLGFEIEFARTGGFQNITPRVRSDDPTNWNDAVARIVDILKKFQPAVVFFPHEDDYHPTHCGTNLLVLDALKKMPEAFSCLTIENEFWRASREPNLLVEFDDQTVTDMISALSFHKGELLRNPYHLTLPAWMIDNVRRGAEIVGGAGGAAPNFTFGALFRVTLYRNKTLQQFFEKGVFLAAGDDPAAALRFQSNQIKKSL